MEKYKSFRTSSMEYALFRDYEKEKKHLNKLYSRYYSRCYLASDILKLNKWMNNENAKLYKKFIHDMKEFKIGYPW